MYSRPSDSRGLNDILLCSAAIYTKPKQLYSPFEFAAREQFDIESGEVCYEEVHLFSRRKLNDKIAYNLDVF